MSKNGFLTLYELHDSMTELERKHYLSSLINQSTLSSLELPRQISVDCISAQALFFISRNLAMTLTGSEAEVAFNT